MLKHKALLLACRDNVEDFTTSDRPGDLEEEECKPPPRQRAPSQLRVEIWTARHFEAAADFCQLMLRIRAEGPVKFQHGMWGLWQAAEALEPVMHGSKEEKGIDPTTYAVHSEYHLRDTRLLPHLVRTRTRALPAWRSPYGAVSERWLLSFEAMGRQIREEHAKIFKEAGCQATALRTLCAALGPPLNGRGTNWIRARIDPTNRRSYRPAPYGLCHQTCEPSDAAVAYFKGSWAILPLVWLPLCFYVRNTSHLYELLVRLQSSAEKRRAGLKSSKGEEGVEELRAELDKDQRRYSFMAFAVTAALQALLLAKAELGAQFPLRLLASSPPDSVGRMPNGYSMMAAEEWPDVSPIFRGIWIGEEADQERTLFQYSFQSFSREVAGVAQVLAFYASVPDTPIGKLARDFRHVLMFVARVKWSDKSSLAMPVQLFEGPKDKLDKYSEMEVLLPPYVRYEFEDDLAMSSAEFKCGRVAESAQAKLDLLASRWDGFTLPDVLLEMLHRHTLPGDYPPEVNALKRPFVSLRFIRSIRIVEPLQQLFTDPAMRLYSFAEEEPGSTGRSNDAVQASSLPPPTKSPTCGLAKSLPPVGLPGPGESTDQQRQGTT